MFEYEYNWNIMENWNDLDSYNKTKEKILSILKEEKASLGNAKLLFFELMMEIEKKNPITL